jgi:hypothetical protein
MEGFMKVCEKHGAEKVLYGSKIRCRECALEAKRKRYQKNREKELSRARKYRVENHEQVVLRETRYRERNKDKIRKRNLNWYKKNRHRWLEYSRRYHNEHKEELQNYNKRWRDENGEKIKNYTEKWYSDDSRRRIAHREAKKIPMASECFLCGVLKGDAILHRHHPDYDRPEYFVTLCPKCHNYIHRLERAKKEALCG